MIQKAFAMAVVVCLFVLGSVSSISAQEIEKGMILIEVVDEFGKPVNIGWVESVSVRTQVPLNTNWSGVEEFVENYSGCNAYAPGGVGAYANTQQTQYLYCSSVSGISNSVLSGEMTYRTLPEAQILSRSFPLTSFRLLLPVEANVLRFSDEMVVKKGVSTGTHQVVKKRIITTSGEIDRNIRYVVSNPEIKIQVEKGGMRVYRLRLREEPFTYVQVKIGRHVKVDSIPGELKLTRTSDPWNTIDLKKSDRHAVSPGLYALKWLPSDRQGECRVVGAEIAEVSIDDICTNERGEWQEHCKCLPNEQLIVMKRRGKVSWKREEVKLSSSKAISHVRIEFNKKRIQLGDVVNIKVGDQPQIVIQADSGIPGLLP